MKTRLPFLILSAALGWTSCVRESTDHPVTPPTTPEGHVGPAPAAPAPDAGKSPKP